jgi:carbamoyl-phosphate synthase large subunit
MKSTGEVMGVADNFGEAFAKAQLRPDRCCRVKGTVFFSVNDHDKAAAGALARRMSSWASIWWRRMARRMCWRRPGCIVERVYKVKEGRPNVVDLIKGDRIQLIINTPRGQDTFFDEKAIRRAAVLARIPTITTMAAALA